MQLIQFVCITLYENEDNIILFVQIMSFNLNAIQGSIVQSMQHMSLTYHDVAYLRWHERKHSFLIPIHWPIN